MAKRKSKSVETLTHGEAARRNIPTAEYHPVMAEEDKAPIRVAYERRNRDLDPQLVWRGKDEQDAADLVVQAPPLYIQEKVHPKVLIDDLLRQTKARREEEAPTGARPLRRFQRPARRRGDDRVLPPRRQLVEPHDPRRQPAGHGLAGGARRPARQGAVHLYRPALRHQASTPTSSGPPPAAT